MTIAIIPAGVPPAAMAQDPFGRVDIVLEEMGWVLPTRAGWILFRSRHNN